MSQTPRGSDCSGIRREPEKVNQSFTYSLMVTQKRASKATTSGELTPTVTCGMVSFRREFTSRMSSSMKTPSSPWKWDPVLASSVTFHLFMALSDKERPAEEGWRKDDADHFSFWRHQILYLTLEIQLKENVERCLWETKVSFTCLLIQDKLLILLHGGQTALVAMQKPRGHLFHRRPVSVLHGIIRGSERFLRKSLWSHSLRFPGLKTGTKGTDSWAYTLKQNTHQQCPLKGYCHHRENTVQSRQV